jgi:transposase
MEKQISVLGVDIAKQVFHLVGMDAHGTILVRKRLYRAQVMAFTAQLPPTLIGMEACGGAHYWARRFREHGHEVKLMAPQFVKPYVKANKNDVRDAEAIAEAVMRPTMRFVAVKSLAQQDLQGHCQVNGQSGRTGWLSGTLRPFRGHFVSPSGTLEPRNQPK